MATQQNRSLIRLYKQRPKGGGMPMTDTGTVSILAWLTTVGNIILYALIIFLVVMWVKKKDRQSRADKTEKQ